MQRPIRIVFNKKCLAAKLGMAYSVHSLDIGLNVFACSMTCNRMTYNNVLYQYANLVRLSILSNWKWFTNNGEVVYQKTFKLTHSDHLVMLLSFYPRVWKLGMFLCIFAVNCCCLCALLDPGGAPLYV